MDSTNPFVNADAENKIIAIAILNDWIKKQGSDPEKNAYNFVEFHNKQCALMKKLLALLVEVKADLDIAESELAQLKKHNPPIEEVGEVEWAQLVETLSKEFESIYCER